MNSQISAPLASVCALQVDSKGNANFTILPDGTQVSNYTQSASPDFTSLLQARAYLVLLLLPPPLLA